MTKRYQPYERAALWLVFFLFCTISDLSAQSRRGYALWCESKGTLYFVQADSQPYEYNGATVTKSWEINDKNLRNGAAAPAWILDTKSNSQTGVPNGLTTVVFEPNFRFVTPAGCYSWFHGCSHLKSVTGLSYLNTSRVGYMNKMFYGCTDLETLDFTGVDMKPVINTTMMFYGCTKLTTIHADGAWTPPYSTYMFTGCEQIQGSVAFDPAHVDGAMATGTNGYFKTDSHIYALSTNSYHKMYFVRSAAEIQVGDTYKGEEVEEVVSYGNFIINYGGDYMWKWSGNGVLYDVVFEPSFRNVQFPTLMHFFKGMYTISSIDGLEYLNTSEATSMRSMFEGCTGLRTLDVSKLDMSHAQDLSRMFTGCKNAERILLPETTIAEVTNMESMFSGCEDLQSIDLSSFDTQHVTDMSHLFEGCFSLTTIDLSPIKTSAVTTMEAMFKGCCIDAVFKSGLEELDVNNFDMTTVTNVREMFLNCGFLKTIYCDKTWNVATSDDMFKGCTSLSSHIAYDPDKVDGTYANPHTGYFYSDLDPPLFDPEGRFIVCNADRWAEFANRVNNGENEQNAVLTKDIDLGNSQVMVGNSDHPYTGTFEGNGHQLKIAYVSEANDCAPFSVTGECTIRNLHVTGTIQTSHKWASGFIGQAKQDKATLYKCWSSVTINSSIDGPGNIGGFIGVNYGQVEMRHCLFDGGIIGENTYGCGGFIGHVPRDNADLLVTINNSLMNATIGFKTDYVSSFASGPFYGFLKSPASSTTSYLYVKIETSCGYTTEFGFTERQGVNLSGETDASVLISRIGGGNDWYILDGKPALKY